MGHGPETVSNPTDDPQPDLIMAKTIPAPEVADGHSTDPYGPSFASIQENRHMNALTTKFSEEIDTAKQSA